MKINWAAERNTDARDHVLNVRLPNLSGGEELHSPLKPLLIVAVLLLGAMSVGAIPAQAASFTVDFVVSGFEAGAPTDPVSGTIGYEASSITAPIDSLTSINMTIGGHAYSVGEVGFISPYAVFQMVGATVNGVGTISTGSDDFWIRWYQNSPSVPFDLCYTTLNSLYNTYHSQNFTSFSVRESNPVPEPSTILLLGSGLVGLVGYGRMRFKK